MKKSICTHCSPQVFSCFSSTMPT